MPKMSGQVEFETNLFRDSLYIREIEGRTQIGVNHRPEQIKYQR